jgi:stage V sporulation protein AE
MLISLALVFLGGGVLCALAQLLIDLTKITPARILVLYVSLGVLLFAVGAYTPLEKIFGSGVSVPLIGFGANIAKGVKEAVDAKGGIGILEGGLSSSAVGITAALLFGLIASIIFKTSSKRL